MSSSSYEKYIIMKLRKHYQALEKIVPLGTITSLRLLQPVLEFIISPLTYIINSCIQNSMFPAVWKTSRISPIPKVDNPSGCDDYRPIAILPVLSKVFENLVLQQMQEFIYNLCLLHNTQSGFRKGHSTTTALLKFKDDISKAMKKGEITLAVFADFSKAFNTVDPEVLINKLSKMNFSKSFLHWLISYLPNREQFVQINDKISSKAIICFGVPQGSLLGPVLFNLHVADMHQNVHLKEECLQYSNHSTLYHHCRIEELETAKLNLELSLSTLNDWSSYKFGTQ